MVARWSFTPVCGVDYWRVISFSPEVLIFLFFMITDPKTVPAGRIARVAFGFCVAVTCVLLMAPQTNEWATKVGLLAGLATMSIARPVIESLFPAPRTDGDTFSAFAARLTGGSALRRLGRVAAIGATALLLAVGIVAAGAPSRGAIAYDYPEVIDRVPHEIDPSTFPTLTVDQEVADWNHTLVGEGAQAIVLTLAENLELENQALLRNDETILHAVSHGDRLLANQARLAEAQTSGRTVVDHYRFDTMRMRLLQPFGKQTGLSIGLDSTGMRTQETYDASGSLIDRQEIPFAGMFVVRRATGGRWLNVDLLPPGSSG